MKIKRFFLYTFSVLVPFLFAVNILRTQVKGQNYFMGTSGFLQLASEIDFSFSDTYVSIAVAGNDWQEFQEEPSFENFFKALWSLIKVPFIAINEFFGAVYDCIMIFTKFVGFMPGTG